MKTMTIRGSPIFRNLLVAAAVVILVFGLKYSSDVLALIFLAATLAILFTPRVVVARKEGIACELSRVKKQRLRNPKLMQKEYCVISFSGLYYMW